MLHPTVSGGVPDAAAHGLCATCRHVRTVVSGKGSMFLMCQRHAADDRYPKYPPLPVRQCSGHQPAQTADPGRT